MNAKLELDDLLKVIQEKGFQPLGLLFYSPKMKLIGIAPMDGVPDAFVEEMGRRLGGIKDGKGTMTWEGVANA